MIRGHSNAVALVEASPLSGVDVALVSADGLDEEGDIEGGGGRWPLRMIT